MWKVLICPVWKYSCILFSLSVSTDSCVSRSVRQSIVQKSC